jgi:hypothetical protein
MEQRPTPAFFYGSAAAALVGLLFGLTLHAAWQKNPGGPQMISAATAAVPAVSPGTRDIRASQPPPTELADQDAGPATPNPLPVTRLAPQMFDVLPAATDPAQRRDAAEVIAGDAPQSLAPQTLARELD